MDKLGWGWYSCCVILLNSISYLYCRAVRSNLGRAEATRVRNNNEI